VAEAGRVPLADLHRASVTELERLGPEEADTLAMPPPDFDRTHLGRKGASLFAQLMARELVAAVPELAMRLASRPQFGEEDAAKITAREVLGRTGFAGRETDDPWDPQDEPLARDRLSRPDFIVDAAASADGRTTFGSLQQAVNAALARGEAEGTGRRLFIHVRPGTYSGPVFVPESRAPITIAGAGGDAAAVRIVATIDAAMPGARHRESFGSRFVTSPGAVAAMATSIQERERVGTSGSAVVWVRSDGFQAAHLTIENGYNRSGSDGPAAMQAVALFVDGADRAHFEGVRLLGLQDTVYLRAPAPGRIARSYFDDSLIEGDVDFVFGDGTAYFRRTELRTRGTRDEAYALAPAHHVRARHGFVFDECRFTHDGSPRALAGRYHLARQWFRGQRCTPYVPRPAIPGYACRPGEADAFDGTAGTVSRAALEAVGKVAILRSRIGSHIDRSRPWADWNAPGTRQHRPVQYHASGYLANLEAAGIDPLRVQGSGMAELPGLPFLGEYRNVQD
jgi:pectin methylesterase-like acyl-CoA thioesterase